MYMRTTIMLIVIATLGAGCSSTPKIETQSYALQNRQAEEALIKGKLDDEAARLGTQRMIEVVKQYGGRLESLFITDDNIAIVKTTPHAHREIQRALEQARENVVSRGGA